MQLDILVEETAIIGYTCINRNVIFLSDFPHAVRHVHASLLVLGAGVSPNLAHNLPANTEVTASIILEYLVSFIDGRAYKTLIRHLTARGMTPTSYRRRYGLPKLYPMVSLC